MSYHIIHKYGTPELYGQEKEAQLEHEIWHSLNIGKETAIRRYVAPERANSLMMSLCQHHIVPIH
jgi:hypothetical protein